MATPNLILEVELVENYVRRGAPEGTEPLAKAIPILLGRIAELERALMPFARVAARREQPTNLPLTQVYFSDCESALKKLSKAAAIMAMPAQTEIAAE